MLFSIVFEILAYLLQNVHTPTLLFYMYEVNGMDTKYIRDRITELRLKKNVSEYQMSTALGQNKGYIQAISSGKALPSMAQFLRICDYFDISPLEFFDSETVNPQLLHQAMEGMRSLSEDDLIMLIGFINRLQSEK